MVLFSGTLIPKLTMLTRRVHIEALGNWPHRVSALGSVLTLVMVQIDLYLTPHTKHHCHTHYQALALA